MKKYFVRFLFICLMFAFTSSVFAQYVESFINPPETTVPGWFSGGAPYQRDIYWDFNTFPYNDPYNKLGPMPGAVYSGSEDEVLKSSDNFDSYDSVGWSQGLLSIMNYGSDLDLMNSGEIWIRLGNLSEDRPIKHVYLEASIFIPDGMSHPLDMFTFGGPYLNLPDGSEETQNYFMWWTRLVSDDEVGREKWLLNAWFEAKPNPLWETVRLPIYNQYEFTNISIDDLHIATECGPVIPEPATMFLLGSGLLGLLGFRRKKS